MNTWSATIDSVFRDTRVKRMFEAGGGATEKALPEEVSKKAYQSAVLRTSLLLLCGEDKIPGAREEKIATLRRRTILPSQLFRAQLFSASPVPRRICGGPLSGGFGTFLGRGLHFPAYARHETKK